MSTVTPPPLASIVIPAHNEESVLQRCLDELLASTASEELDVIVVANGCTDGTAAIARRHGVRVIETPVPGKANALRLGDAACTTFPRVYLDADVVLSTDSVRALVEAAARPGVLACAPAPEWDLAGAGPVAKRIHRVHDLLMAGHRALAGTGVYVLSPDGHSRVFPLPDVIADDEWVHRSFTGRERAVVPGARSVVRPPRTVREHLRRRVRVRSGNRQLTALGRPAATRVGAGELGALLVRRAVSPVDVACYLSVLLLDRALTRAHGSRVGWATDGSSRV